MAGRLRALGEAGARVVEIGRADEEQLGPALAALRDLGITGELILLLAGGTAPLPDLDALTRVAVWRTGTAGGGDPDPAADAKATPAVDEVLDAQIERRRQRRVPHVDRDPRWTVTLPGAKGTERLAESLGSLANGHAGVRAALEEGGPRSSPLFVVAGVYDADSRLLPGPVWAEVDVGGPAGAGRQEPGPEERVVDLRSGVLWRRPVGGTGITSLRFLSMADPHALALRMEAGGDLLSPPGPDRPLLRPPRGGCGFVAERIEGGELATTGQPGQARIAVAARDVGTSGRGWTGLERLAGWAAGGDGPGPEAVRRLAAAEAAGFDNLLAAQRRAMAARWRHAGVWIDGSPSDELAARFAVFHLLGTAADSGESAVGPRGLTGEAYAGHVFWDADVFVLPALAAIRPAAARSMLEYRLRRLPEARNRARSAGRQGARFPWESAGDGTDVTPRWVRGRDGEVVPIRTGRHEVHVVADVAWSAWLYADWTGDRSFLRDGPGRELMIETARYWASRIRVDRTGRGHIYGVMGPDEYHEVVDDNAFTNVMARWNLRAAAGLLAGGQPPGSPEGREADRWLQLAEGLVDGWDPGRRTFEQFAGYYGLERLEVREIAEPPVAVDMVIPPKRVAGSQLIKQADVLMLHHMLPGEVPDGSLGPTLDFYGPRTAHGSSLSPAIHASLLARAGRPEEALRMYRLAARLDLDDVTGTTTGGLHLATMGGVWQALAYGFLGLRAESGMLTVDPRLPGEWSALTMRFSFRGVAVEVRADHRRVTLACDGPVRVSVGAGPPVTVGPPGGSWPLPSGAGDPAGAGGAGAASGAGRRWDQGPC